MSHQDKQRKINFESTSICSSICYCIQIRLFLHCKSSSSEDKVNFIYLPILMVNSKKKVIDNYLNFDINLNTVQPTYSNQGIRNGYLNAFRLTKTPLDKDYFKSRSHFV